MLRSRARTEPHPLASAALVLTGLTALVGALIVVGVGAAEWLHPWSPGWWLLFKSEPRPFDLLPLATLPCLVGAAGQL